jgi:hypothetical protein
VATQRSSSWLCMCLWQKKRRERQKRTSGINNITQLRIRAAAGIGSACGLYGVQMAAEHPVGCFTAPSARSFALRVVQPVSHAGFALPGLVVSKASRHPLKGVPVSLAVPPAVLSRARSTEPNCQCATSRATPPS